MRNEWEEQPSSSPPDDFYIVKIADTQTFVSRETAQAIEAVIDQWPDGPRWLTFSDIEGSRVRCRTRAVWLLFESTPATRAVNRAFIRARKAEDKSEKDWGTDD